MPNPKNLVIGDKIRFTSRPEEWSAPNFTIQDDDITFIDKLIEGGCIAEVNEVDEYGNPWVFIRVKIDGENEEHAWSIFESTGWELAIPTTKQ